MRNKRDWLETVGKAREESTSDDNRPAPNCRAIFNRLIAIGATDRVATWRGFQKWADVFQDTWAFRGHADTAWQLETYLDREAFLHCEGKYSSLMMRRGDVYEKMLLDEFQKRAHQYLRHFPGDDEVIDWLALMQHYGAPTRLLDWTRSPYVALYFAVANSAPRKTAAVWAIDCGWALKQSANSCGQFDSSLSHTDLLAKMSRFVNGRLVTEADFREPHGVAFPVAPRRVNERMAAQQGLLLCRPPNEPAFDIALLTMILHDKNADNPPVRKLIVRARDRITFLRELRRMNITAASLFPGLDGFAQSLAAELKIKMFEEKERIEAENKTVTGERPVGS